MKWTLLDDRERTDTRLWHPATSSREKTERKSISLSLTVPWVGLNGGGNWVELEDAMKKAYLHFWQSALKSLLMKAFDF